MPRLVLTDPNGKRLGLVDTDLAPGEFVVRMRSGDVLAEWEHVVSAPSTVVPDRPTTSQRGATRKQAR